LNSTFVTNHLYTEGTTKFEISFQHIANVKKKYFETTLLDNLQLSNLGFDYYNLFEAVTIRCSPWDHVKSRFLPHKIGKYIATVTIDNKDSESSEWSNFEYASYIGGENTMDRFVEQCRVSALRFEERDDAAQQTDAEHHHITSTNFDADETNGLPTQREKDVAVSNWIGDIPDSNRTSLSVFTNTLPARGSLPKQSPQASVIAESSNVFASNVDSTKTSPEDAKDPFDTADENIADFNLNFPVVSPGQRPSISISPVQPQYTQSNPSAQTAQTPLIEYLQTSDEISSRLFQLTMNQRAAKKQEPSSKVSKPFTFASRLEAPPPVPRQEPSPKALVVDPTPEFTTEIKGSLTRLATQLRGFQGEIVIQADFGRHLLKQINRGLIASSGESEHSVPVVACQIALETSASVFTKVLTDVSADMSYLVALKNDNGLSMWKPSNPRWSVVYEIHSTDRSGRPFMVEINGEKFEHRVTSKRDLGAINIHSLKRHWDVKVSATGIEVTENPELLEFAQAIMKSLYIP